MKTLEDIIKPYVYWMDDVSDICMDEDKHWDTDDLIELGVLINKILKDRDG